MTEIKKMDRNCRTMDRLHSQIYKNLSPAQKWQQVCQLREIAWMLKTAGIKAQHPEWNEAQVQKAVRKIFLYAVT